LGERLEDLLGSPHEIFKAHSMRGASASAALKKGLHIKDILETADWSCKSTFRMFYC